MLTLCIYTHIHGLSTWGNKEINSPLLAQSRLPATRSSRKINRQRPKLGIWKCHSWWTILWEWIIFRSMTCSATMPDCHLWMDNLCPRGHLRKSFARGSTNLGKVAVASTLWISGSCLVQSSLQTSSYAGIPLGRAIRLFSRSREQRSEGQ